MKKAIGLISGGLDSILALQLIMEQGFEIIGIFVKTPFLANFGEKTIVNLKNLSKEMNFKFIVIEAENDYIEMVKNPLFGYGKNLNPCIDCHIYMAKKAKEIMEKENALFVFTGEILGQRGKSQNLNALKLVEEKSSLKGRILRPLTALNLPPTNIEKEGVVKRDLLLGIKGKERKLQLYLAQLKNLKYFETPSGGCLLTDPIFCKKLKDLFENSEKIDLNDCYILQIGKHFRISPETKLIITRNIVETEKIKNFLNEKDFILFSENSEIIGVIKGKITEICFDIYGAYLKKEINVIELKNLKGETLERKIVRKTEKIIYHNYLI